MNLKLTLSPRHTVLAAVLWLLAGNPMWGGTLTLEGQNKGDTNNWYAGNLQNWLELNYIPCRAYAAAVPGGGTYTVSVVFPHFNGTTPGFQDLTAFAPSPNAVITAGPTLDAPVNSASWSYTFTFTVTDGNPGWVRFLARLAAGSHLNTGSSLALSAIPNSMGTLQVHKPAAGVGLPDLMIVKSGVASVRQGDMITYTLSYTNTAPAGTTTAVGSQISDILPPQVTVVPGSISSGGSQVGNSIFWDLGDLVSDAYGVVSFQAIVNADVAFSSSFTNFCQILSSEDDVNYADNTSRFVSTTGPCTSPAIATGLENLVKCPGEDASFSVVATGTEPLTYRWFKGGVVIPGQTNNALTLSSVSTGDSGSYSVVATGPCGSVTSSATLVVNQKVVVIEGPLSVTNCAGTSTGFAVSATGTGLSYQWYKSGSVLPGEVGSSLALNNVSGTDAGIYSVVISGACGDSVTNSASLIVDEPLVVTGVPVSLTNCPGTSASFSVSAVGSDLSFQWYKGSSPLFGETGSSLTLSALTAADAGVYRVVVSGACGIVTNSASLAVNENVVVASSPASRTNCAGTSASFSIVATGTELSYQWYKDGSALSGQTGSSLVLDNVSNADAGIYAVVVSGACGSPVTNSASLAVNESVVVTTAPVSLTNCPGTRARFVVVATGTGLGYQWYKNGSVLSGQTGVNLVLREVTAADAGTYSAVVSGTCGSPVTNSASLTVNEAVAVTSAPLS